MAGRSALMRGVRVAALLAGLGVLCLSVVTGVMAGRARESAALDHQLAGDVAEQADLVSAYFERARAVNLLLAQNPAFSDFYSTPGSTAAKIAAGGPLLTRVNTALAYLQTLYPDRIGEACFIDPGGREVARVTHGFAAFTEQLSPDESRNPFFYPTLGLRLGQVYQARPYVSPDTGHWVISNSTLVAAPTGRSAIVHFEVTLDSFRASSDADHADGLHQDGLHQEVVSIVDARTGAIVVDSRTPMPAGAPLGRPGDTSLAGLARREGAGMTTVADRRMAYRRVDPGVGNANSWIVVVSSPRLPATWSRGLGAGSLAMMSAALATIVVAGVSLRSYQRSLRQAALHDPLTGLPNRALLADRLAQALRAAARGGDHVAVMIIDLDRFKEVNDTLGHHVGDLLLRQVADRLAATIRGADSIARLGGDEFAVLLPVTSTPTDATAVADRVLAALHDSFTLDGIIVDVEASIGIAVSPEHGQDGGQLLRRADVAMYVAKELKTGRAVYDAAHDVHAPARLALLGDLRRALDAGDQIVLHYQPKMDLALGQLNGVEALARWHHPERGLVMPGDFIPAAENTALIQRLTHHVLDQALGQARAWLDAGTPTPVAVNLSTRCLLDDAFPRDVLDLLDRHALPPALLHLEITESAIMADPDKALHVLRLLHQAEIRLSIDDFGTGYSSMAYLKQLPVDEIKIDRSFVTHMTTDPNDATLVRSAIDLGHNLGLAVVAEGVEDQATLDHLRDLGCDLAQGYHLGRPTPADRINHTPILASQTAPDLMTTGQDTETGTNDARR
jgi:diguanylate cyclase (GGDEF)-like protein